MTRAHQPLAARSRLAALLWPAGLAVLVLVGCWPLFRADFTSWDDPHTLAQNPLMNPPTLTSLRALWAARHIDLYMPMVYTVWSGAYWFGRATGITGVPLDPHFFHALSICTHLLTTWIVLAILRRLGFALSVAGAGAAVFAIHPVQIESIGWVSGMKDLLAGLFGAGSIYAYIRAVRSGSDVALSLSSTANEIAASSGPTTIATRRAARGWLFVAWGMFGFAILSKPSAVVLPAVWGAIDLLLLRAAWRATAWRVMPMLVVSVGWTIFTKRLQPAETFTAIALWERFIVAGDAVAFYCRKLIFPAGLAFDYGRSPQHVLGAGTAYLTCAAAAGVFGVLAIFRARIKIVFASVVIGLIFVSPVLGFIPFHMQRYSTVADHYLYSAMLGLAVAMCGVMARFRRVVPVVLCSAVVLSILSHRQSRVWRDSDSLYTQGWAVNAQSFASANGLAGEALLRGDLESARLWSDRSLAINGQNVPAIATRAAIDIRAGDIASARKRLEYALRLAPRDLRILGMLRAIDRPQDR